MGDILFKGRILTRSELSCRGLLWVDNDLSCILCGHREESLDHLFCVLDGFILWSKFIEMMGVSWALNSTCVGILERWQVKHRGRDGK